jgi:hypothetical protein
MKRREFIAGLAGAATWPFAQPLAAEAQRRVGALSFIASPQSQSILDAFREGWRLSAGSKAVTCGLILVASPAIPALSLRMWRN